MLTITEYLKKIFEEFKNHCDKGTQSMWELKSCMNQIKKNNPDSTSSKLYSNPAFQQLYLLKYAYEYGFEYLSMYNEFIEDFADREEISVVSLGCGTMLDYWALAYMLDKKKLSRPVVRYLGIDAAKWNHSLETEVRGKDKETFKFSEERFEDFFKKTDNEFNTHDVYFFPKSISEFSDKNSENRCNDIEIMLDHLSAMEKDSVYFCISLRKGDDRVDNSDIRKVQKIIDKLKGTGFCVEYVKCITDTEATAAELKEKGLRAENIEFIRLGADRNISTTDAAKELGGYPEILPDGMIEYITKLEEKCVHKSSEKDKPCDGCKEGRNHPCRMNREQTMKNTKYICDLVIKFERDRR